MSWLALRPKSTRERISSDGSVGTELKAIAGSVTGPESVMTAVMPPVTVSAFRFMTGAGGVAPVNEIDPSVSLNWRSTKSKRPRTSVRRPVTTGSSDVPVTLIAPSHSESRPWPRTKTRLGSLSDTLSRTGFMGVRGAEGGGPVAPGRLISVISSSASSGSARSGSRASTGPVVRRPVSSMSAVEPERVTSPRTAPVM